MQNPPTVGLKWKAADGSSPLAIVLSKHSPEVAAKNANTTTALDCARPDVLYVLALERRHSLPDGSAEVQASWRQPKWLVFQERVQASGQRRLIALIVLMK